MDIVLRILLFAAIYMAFYSLVSAFKGKFKKAHLVMLEVTKYVFLFSVVAVGVMFLQYANALSTLPHLERTFREVMWQDNLSRNGLFWQESIARSVMLQANLAKNINNLSLLVMFGVIAVVYSVKDFKHNFLKRFCFNPFVVVSTFKTNTFMSNIFSGIFIGESFGFIKALFVKIANTFACLKVRLAQVSIMIKMLLIGSVLFVRNFIRRIYAFVTLSYLSGGGYCDSYAVLLN
ncbi:MAG: hypothetical protein FWB72_07140 [Firmicutes bacterium]|nr:hypothetical protein [Bacillota bacterium]